MLERDERKEGRKESILERNSAKHFSRCISPNYHRQFLVIVMTFDVAFVVCIFIANLLVPCKEWNDKKKEEKEEKGKSIWEYAARDNPDEYNNSETGCWIGKSWFKILKRKSIRVPFNWPEFLPSSFHSNRTRCAFLELDWTRHWNTLMKRVRVSHTLYKRSIF